MSDQELIGQSSLVSLPKLEQSWNSKNTRRNTQLQQRINTIRESQQNIQQLEQITEEFLRPPQSVSFISLPQFIANVSNQVLPSSQYLDIHPHSTKPHLNHSNNPKVIWKSKLSQDESTLFGNQQGQKDQKQQKFKRITVPSLKQTSHTIHGQSSEEEAFIRENWADQQRFELPSGDRLGMLFKNLAANLQALSQFKSEKYCLQIIDKYANYNRRLRKLIDIDKTPIKDFSSTLLLTRYLSILYKTPQLSKVKDSNITSPHITSDPYANQQQSFVSLSHSHAPNSQSQRDLISTPLASEIRQKKKPQQPIPQVIHDKQFLDNILDLNARLEAWIIQMQKNQIALTENKLLDITKQVADKEIVYKNQLILHQKRQSYVEMEQIFKNKYTLNLRSMKSNLAQQIRECEEKNGDVKFISKLATSKSGNIDKVISALERLEFQ